MSLSLCVGPVLPSDSWDRQQTNGRRFDSKPNRVTCDSETEVSQFRLVQNIENHHLGVQSIRLINIFKKMLNEGRRRHEEAVN